MTINSRCVYIYIDLYRVLYLYFKLNTIILCSNSMEIIMEIKSDDTRFSTVISRRYNPFDNDPLLHHLREFRCSAAAPRGGKHGRSRSVSFDQEHARLSISLQKRSRGPQIQHPSGKQAGGD